MVDDVLVVDCREQQRCAELCSVLGSSLTRARVLILADGSSLEELASRMGVSRSVAAYHVSVLERAGLLEAWYERARGRGPAVKKAWRRVREIRVLLG